MTAHDQKRIILVLGMHRTGTSAITRGLMALGVDIGDPENLLPPAADNETGFWEDTDIKTLNDQLLDFLGLDWQSMQLIRSEEFSRPGVDPFKLQAINLLRQRLGESEIYGIKDPRMCKLLPFWKPIFDQLEYKVGYIITCRHPMSVVKSLQKRERFSAEKSHYLWALHIEEALRHSENHKRVIVDYDLLIDHPQKELEKIIKALGLPPVENRKSQIEEYIHAFLRPDLRHSYFTLDDLKQDSSAPMEVVDLYQILLEITQNKIDLEAPETVGRISEITTRLNQLRPAFDLISQLDSDTRTLATVQQNLIEQQEATRSLQARLSQRDEELQATKKLIVKQESQLSTQLSKIQALMENKAEQSVALRALVDELEEKDQQLIEKTEENNQLAEVAQSSQLTLQQTLEELTNRNGQLADRDKKIKDLKQTLKLRNSQLDEQLKEINQSLEKIAAYDAILAEINETSARREQQLKKQLHQSVLSEKESEEKREKLQQELSFSQNAITQLQQTLNRTKSDLCKVIDEKGFYEGAYNTVINSTCWKITGPLRRILDAVKTKVKSTKQGTFFYKALVHLRFKGISSAYNRGIDMLTKKPAIACEKAGVAIISGCPGDAMRYRCHHTAEKLALEGQCFNIFEFHNIDWDDVIHQHNILILHRVPITPNIEDAIKKGQNNNKVFVFDSDDLVFDVEYAEHTNFLSALPENDRILYIDGLNRYNRTFNLCRFSSGSTSLICDEMNRLKPKAHKALYIKNVVSQEMLEICQKALQAKPCPRNNRLIIGYMSGTNTHNHDFQLIECVLIKLMDKYPHITLHIAGHLELSTKFDAYRNRVVRIPYMSWKELPFEIAKLDINLAPLEDTLFNNAKSDLKHFEAALVKVPTVASDIGAFSENIIHGTTGLLAATEEEWITCLEQLIQNADLRREIGENAYAEVVSTRTTRSVAKNDTGTLFKLRDRIERKKVINWVVQAPFKGSGGYTTIFRMAGLLTDLGYTNNIYMDAIAHFSNMEKQSIYDYVHSHFNTKGLNLFVGHSQFLNADYTFATGWPTVDVVKTITNTRHKLYFVQDYEPNFYEEGSTEYHLATKSYQQGLIPLSIGPYLIKKINREFGIQKGYHFEFASDRSIYFKDNEKYPKMRIIFYARPSTKRRGFQTGIEALEKVYLKHSDQVEFALYGSDRLAEHNIPFPYIDLGILPQNALAQEFAKSHIGVCFSLSNMSLVPLDMMSCKCAVVEIDSERVEGTLKDGYNCLLAEYDAEHIASKIDTLITDTEKRDRIIKTAFEYVSNRSWEKSAQQIRTALQKLK